jgi:hypothetical protein
LFAKPATIISAPKSKGIKGAPVGSIGTVELLTFCFDEELVTLCLGTCTVTLALGDVLDTGVLGTATVAVAICPGIVAELIKVVPATDALGVTYRVKTSFTTLVMVPTFHM